MTHATPELSVVLPCYNECQGLARLCERFAQVGQGTNFELILVDNGSTDATPHALRSLLAQFPFARSVRVERNRGYGHGLYTGLASARGEVVAWSHADMQTDPADVFRALAEYHKLPARETTLVKGTRRGRKFSERVVSWGQQTLATLIFRRWMHEINAQPKLFHRSLLAHVTHPPLDFNFDVYVLFKALRQGWVIRELPVNFPPRQYGVSNWAATWRSKARTITRSLRYMLGLAWRGEGVERAERAAAAGERQAA